MQTSLKSKTVPSNHASRQHQEIIKGPPTTRTATRKTKSRPGADQQETPKTGANYEGSVKMLDFKNWCSEEYVPE